MLKPVVTENIFKDIIWGSRALRSYFKTLLFFLLIGCLVNEASAATIRITNFRFINNGAKHRLVFDANGPIDYTIRESAKKIVVNIKDAKLIALLNKTWLYKTPIRTVQSETVGKTLRLTLNLKHPVKLHDFALSKPYRLVLDLSGSNIVPVKKDKSEQVFISKQDEGEAALVDDNKKLRDVIVVIDPGHGGSDPGAIGLNRTREKDVALAVARILQKIINRTKGFHAVLTRNGDYFISLRKRLDIAHHCKADMFIAIHADAFIYRDRHGASVFALSQRGATSEAARWLAKKENESELGQVISDKNEMLKSVLIDLAQAATISASLEIGDRILQELTRVTHLHSPNIEQAAFVVLKSPDIPSLLVETGFISDPYEEKRLRNAQYQQEIATCLADGITTYFTHRPPEGTYLARMKNELRIGSRGL